MRNKSRPAQGTDAPEEFPLTRSEELEEARQELIESDPLGWFQGTLRLARKGRPEADDWEQT